MAEDSPTHKAMRRAAVGNADGQPLAHELAIQYRNIDTLIPYINNARTHSDEQVAQIAASIKEFGWTNPVLVDGDNGIIAGHGRVLAARKLEATEIPVIELQGLSEAQRRAYILADNRLAQNAGWDEDLLHLELTELGNADFDLSLLGFEPGELAGFLEDEQDAEDDFNETEIPIGQYHEAWREFAGQVAAQYDLLKTEGSSFSGITEGYAKIKFLQSKHQGNDYPRNCSLAFHPQQFLTSGDLHSAYEGLRKVADGSIKAERLIFVSGDDPRTTAILAGSLPFSGARLPLDFPARLARDLINEFATEGAVLDPCSGWGGRLVGFLLSDANKYVGVDVSPLQVAGVQRIDAALRPLADKGKFVEIICEPYEATNIAGKFDLAITSPPYFGVEQYIGGEQSHKIDKYEAWRTLFYKPLIEKTFASLKKGGTFALQVGSQRYPLLEDGKIIAEKIGFTVIETRSTKMVNTFKDTDEEHAESIIILRK